MIIPLIRRLSGWIEAACIALAAVALAYMVFVVGFNVLARIVFDLTDTAINFMIPGAIEQVSYLLGLIALAALTASMSGGMIAVDILVGRLPGTLQILIARLWFVAIIVFALTLSWLFYHETLATFARQEETQDLRLPMYLIYGLYTLESLALAVVALREALTNRGQHAELS
ncbi:TRAP transporter small permease [Pseudodonghicola flavimaris]|uniref:TRAP transporter small permease protein n=1 Tax=Pseudodonghicola flavimaris TaxID=3050036 RepID=A0ABT7F2L1_9RHOB|nr:TRAP transporter small permease subunit [Pseudodonghicola flavimaris]MDK3018849.1 TRAP transporter small permease subunit [Pseudodonghicola flavimaris]